MNMNELIKVLQAGTKALGVKAPAGTPSTNLIHGPGGLFGIAGLDNQVISARITPMGIASQMQLAASRYMNPEFPYITGIREVSGQTEPSTKCSTCLSGETKSCIQTAQFGYVCRESQELEIGRTIQRINSGEVDLQLVNEILGNDGDPFMSTESLSRETSLDIETAWAMVEVGAMFQNALVPMLWQGNPANNVGDGYREFPGLDMLIGTDKVDAHTGAECAALDSDVKEFNYNDLSFTNAEGAYMIVRYMNAMALYLKHNATRQGLMPVEWVIAMRPELWAELLEIWPVAYFATREFTLPAGNTNFIDATRVRELRDDMAQGMYIDVAGMRYTVSTDDGIFEHTNVNNANVPAGDYASSIYFVPMRYMGNRQGTYLEYLDYRFTSGETSAMNGKEDFWVSDNGRFMWVVEKQKWCYTLSGRVEPRVILKVPQLAGKIEHVLYSPEQHFRDFDITSVYCLDGGETSRTSPSLYADWELPAQ
jgi:hypothetical protein